MAELQTFSYFILVTTGTMQAQFSHRDHQRLQRENIFKSPSLPGNLDLSAEWSCHRVDLSLKFPQRSF